jgi:hypothetical protein
MSNECLYAVLTGDIVGSSKLSASERQQIPSVLHEASENISRYFERSMQYEVDIFRGDSWQLVISEPSNSLRIGLFFRAIIRATLESRKVDTRLSIGIGTTEFIPESNVSTGNGEAFRLSGEALERFDKSTRMKIAFPIRYESGITHAFDVIVQLIDLLAQRWTSKQAEAVSGALVGMTQRAIAAEWVTEPVSQQAISQHLELAGWTQIERGLDFFELRLPALLEPF